MIIKPVMNSEAFGKNKIVHAWLITTLFIFEKFLIFHFTYYLYFNME